MKICETRENVLNILFGPSERCTDYFNKRERIKIKTWAQNYGLFSSVGINVRSQKRRFRVWWASKADELELGYSLATFKYENIAKWPQPQGHDPSKYLYEYEDWILDQNGNYVYGNNPTGPIVNDYFTANPARGLFEDFPMPNDRNFIKIWIYQPIQDVIKKITGKAVTHLEYTGKDFNDTIRELVKDAVKNFVNKGRKLTNQNEAVVIFEDPNWNDINFIYTNWRASKMNENKISNVFEWNTAQIGITINMGSGNTPIYSPPKKPKDFNIIGYGMGRRGTTWKGGKIVMTD